MYKDIMPLKLKNKRFSYDIYFKSKHKEIDHRYSKSNNRNKYFCCFEAVIIHFKRRFECYQTPSVLKEILTNF